MSITNINYNTMPKYFNLYKMLDRFQFILANSLEQGLKEEYNEPLYQAMSDYNYEYYSDMSDEDLKSEGWDGDQDREEWIQERDYPEIYQTYIVTERGYDILKDYGEIVWYNEDINLHFWGVTHFGTAWSYVMADQYPVDNKDRYYDYDSKLCKFDDCENEQTGYDLMCDQHKSENF